MGSIRRWLAEERPVWVAWLVLFAGSLALAILLPNDHHWILEEGVLSATFLLPALSQAVLCVYLVLLIRLVRGSKRQPESPESIGKRPLGSWGYIWRSYAILMLSILPLFSWSLSFLARGRTVPRVPPWALWFLFLFASPILTWLIFGRNRLTTVKKVLTRSRGTGV
jgi:hypothetical protein